MFSITFVRAAYTEKGIQKDTLLLKVRIHLVTSFRQKRKSFKGGYTSLTLILYVLPRKAFVSLLTLKKTQ